MSEALRILIVDDDKRMVKTLVDILQVKNHQAEAAFSGEEALEKINESSQEGGSPYDCILTDMKMPGLNGAELYHAIRHIQPDLPVVLMTAYASSSLIDEALDNGAIAMLAKPLNIRALLSFLTSLKRKRSVVIVDNDANFCRTMGDVLRIKGFDVTQITEPDSFRTDLEPTGQIVMLDMKLNGISGLDILKKIKAKFPHMPVLMVTGHRDEMASAIEISLKISAHTCLYKPVDIEELLQVLGVLRNQDLGRILGRTIIKRRYIH